MSFKACCCMSNCWYFSMSVVFFNQLLTSFLRSTSPFRTCSHCTLPLAPAARFHKYLLQNILAIISINASTFTFIKSLTCGKTPGTSLEGMEGIEPFKGLSTVVKHTLYSWIANRHTCYLKSLSQRKENHTKSAIVCKANATLMRMYSAI